MKCIKPKKCFYWAWDDICLSMCEPCKNPYRCTVKITYPDCMTINDIIDMIMDDFLSILCPIGKCSICSNKLRCDMLLMSMRMIERGDY